MYLERGAYAQAEPLVARALATLETAQDPESLAAVLASLGGLYMEQGAYAKAEPLLARTLALLERESRMPHQRPLPERVATALANLAAVYLDQRAYDKAEPLFARALAIHEGAWGPQHPDVATSLENLARLHLGKGDHARAEPLLTRALAIRESALGAQHPNVARTLRNLASVHRDRGDYTQAEALLQRALTICEAVLGPQHPSVAFTLYNLSGVFRDQGRFREALPLAARTAEIYDPWLQTEMSPLSEARKRVFLRTLPNVTNSLVSLHADSMPDSTEALELALTTVLRSKGRVLDASTESQSIVRTQLASDLRAQVDELAAARAQLSALLQGPDAPTEISALRSRIEDLEATLSAASVAIRVNDPSVTWTSVQAALPRGAVLVELIRYHGFWARNAREEDRQSAHYLAYLLPWRGPPRWVPLGDVTAIDASVDAVMAIMYKRPSDAASAALRTLDAQLLAPIRERLADLPGTLQLIISPEGKLNLVPFDSLLDEHGRYLLERYLVSYVTSGRDLLRLATRQPPQSAAMIIGAPDYGPGRRFPELAEAAAEAREIARYFTHSRVLLGAEASTRALADVTGPAILHIATHGFYTRGGGPITAADRAAPDRIAAPALSDAVRSDRGMEIDGADLPLHNAPIEAVDRAGLALAGANARPEGILTAREIAGMNWWGTQLVVLSACQTGVGFMSSGDGVYGMRRALVLAGSETQVVSLWNVNDSSARTLMRAFYRELSHGTGRAESLRRAKLALLRRQPPGQPDFSHPYYWAAFIIAGDWTPLRPGTMRE
jgi:CHAT domain-containing protein/tetratricopeptide (TPR) repeat protein